MRQMSRRERVNLFREAKALETKPVVSSESLSHVPTIAAERFEFKAVEVQVVKTLAPKPLKLKVVSKRMEALGALANFRLTS